MSENTKDILTAILFGIALSVLGLDYFDILFY
jgi:hypothetical protein